MKNKKIRLSEKKPSSSRRLVERGKGDNTSSSRRLVERGKSNNTHILDRALSSLRTGTPIKSGRFKLFLW